MRLLRLELTGADDAPPGTGRSILRLIASAVAVALIFIGFLPVLVDERRRALQDLLATTVVIYEPAPAPPPSTNPNTEDTAPFNQTAPTN